MELDIHWGEMKRRSKFSWAGMVGLGSWRVTRDFVLCLVVIGYSENRAEMGELWFNTEGSSHRYRYFQRDFYFLSLVLSSDVVRRIFDLSVSAVS